LPGDVTERELHLLFYEGGPCDAIKLQRQSSGSCTAFVQFPTKDRAVMAQAFANGMVFDPLNANAFLRVEFAKNDFRTLPGQHPAPAPVHQPQYAHQPPPPRAAPPLSHVVPPPTGVKRPHWQMAQPQQGGSCTLFIGSLGSDVGVSELQDYCASQEGFTRLSIKGEGTPKASAWAEYATHDHASMALSILTHTPLSSLGRPPNLEMAKNDTNFGTGRARTAAPPMQAPPPMAAPHHSSANTGGSSTVFIGGLEPQVQEQEVYALAMTQEGCLNVSCRGLGQARATAWAQYDSPHSAAMACEGLRQIPVPSMDRPANIEIARNDMRRG